jgi:hypothetical protein
MAVGPTRLTIRAYGVGFGDCFLLTFHYPAPTGARHVLIDFGTTQKPPRAGRDLMNEIARDIAERVGETLHMIVATHRHTDHISGFATRRDGKGPGDRIAKLNPSLVVQPWTERPDAPTGLTAKSSRSVNTAMFASLSLMRHVAKASLGETRHLHKNVRDEIRFLGEDALSNLSAVRNLARMGKKTKAAYVSYGSRLPTASLLPGVKVQVLGPPTLKQQTDLANQNPVNRAEYWHFHAFWQLRAGTAALPGSAWFPKAETCSSSEIPAQSRWFVSRITATRGTQLLRIVRAMDDALNNTSVILLFVVGGKRFLFPGDAQWENWEYALGRARARLTKVDLYKVGHHGSLNATPKTLWTLLSGRTRSGATPARLATLVSTRSNSKHGHRDRKTEVPRETLLAELRKGSTFRSTQELEGTGKLALELTFTLRR